MENDTRLSKEVENRLEELSFMLRDLVGELENINKIALALTGHKAIMNWLADYSATEYLSAKKQEQETLLFGPLGSHLLTDIYYKFGARNVRAELQNLLRYFPPSIRSQYEAALRALRENTHS